MAKFDDAPLVEPADAGDTGVRASSLWPDTARLRGANAGSTFEISRFDPLHEQRRGPPGIFP